jgi:hypothetical protein
LAQARCVGLDESEGEGHVTWNVRHVELTRHFVFNFTFKLLLVVCVFSAIRSIKDAIVRFISSLSSPTSAR